MPFTPERLQSLSYGYDLDCGGYAFENPGNLLEAVGAVTIDADQAIPDSFPWANDVEGGFWGLSCPLYAFAPGHHPRELSRGDSGIWPQSLPGPWEDGGVYSLKGCGYIQETDRECHCHGQVVDESWEAFHDGHDEPHPDCERCEGDGYVTSDGGAWALYGLSDDEASS